MSVIKSFAPSIRIVVVLYGMFGHISTHPVEGEVKECWYLHDTQTVRYGHLLNAEEREKHCYADLYDMMDLFGCDDKRLTYIREECLMCGLSNVDTFGKELCKNGKDNPQRYLTCDYCKTYNPCKNKGTVHCGSSKSYASEMKCRCANNYYYGTYCQYLKYVCVNDDNNNDLQPCNADPLETCKMTSKGESYSCTLTEEEEDFFTKTQCYEQDLPLSGMVKRGKEEDRNVLYEAYIESQPQIIDELYYEI